jgi:hypothetical protein
MTSLGGVFVENRMVENLEKLALVGWKRIGPSPRILAIPGRRYA